MNFQENYAHMTDDDLLMVASSRGELLPEAVSALDTEMAKRGLSNEQARAKKREVTRLEIKEARQYRPSRKSSKYFIAKINGWIMLLVVLVPLAIVIALMSYHWLPEKWFFPILNVSYGFLICIAMVQPWVRQTVTFWFSLFISCAVQLLVGHWISVHWAPSSRSELKGAAFLTLGIGYVVGATLFLLLQKVKHYQDPNTKTL